MAAIMERINKINNRLFEIDMADFPSYWGKAGTFRADDGTGKVAEGT